MGFFQILYTIPSLALLVLLIPFVGLGLDNAVIVLVTYAQVILVRNIVVGLNGVEPAVVEAARGMGMRSWQILARVELPLALPLIFAGIRTAVENVIATATIASGAFWAMIAWSVLLFSQPWLTRQNVTTRPAVIASRNQASSRRRGNSRRIAVTPAFRAARGRGEQPRAAHRRETPAGSSAAPRESSGS